MSTATTRAVLAALLLVLPALLPATALAEPEIQFMGSTAQDEGVKLLTHDSDDDASDVIVGWRARCARGRPLARITQFTPQNRSTFTRVRSGGIAFARRADGARLRIRSRLTGVRFDRGHPVRDRWVGRVTFVVTVKRRGRVVDTCAARNVRWRVARWGATSSLRVDGAVGPHAFDAQSARMTGMGVDWRISVGAYLGNGDWWSFVVEPPKGEELVAGRTYEAEPWDGVPHESATMELSSPLEPDCQGGRFTVHRIAYNTLGWVSGFAASFACGDAMHGTVELRTPSR